MFSHVILIYSITGSPIRGAVSGSRRHRLASFSILNNNCEFYASSLVLHLIPLRRERKRDEKKGANDTPIRPWLEGGRRAGGGWRDLGETLRSEGPCGGNEDQILSI